LRIKLFFKNYLNSACQKEGMAKKKAAKKKQVKKDTVAKVMYWVLLVLLGMRALVSLLITVATPQLSTAVMGIAYVAAITGIVQGKKWGSGLAMGIVLFDIIYAVAFVGGNVAFGAMLVDVIILGLAYKEYNK
jgi:sterol desaturase/sphingolipid hydroxylase (fatty acid hydroxylase superfamily)